MAIVFVDPTSPNILQFRAGAEVNRVLSRPFFVELQSRYGNIYYVREEVCNDMLNTFKASLLCKQFAHSCLVEGCPRE